MTKTLIQAQEYATPACRVVEVKAHGVMCQSPLGASIDAADENDYGAY